MLIKSFFNRNNIFSSFIILVIFALLFPQSSNSGINEPFPVTDSENSRLIGYWDLRERETFFQVTNTSSSDIRIHIQVFDVSNQCAEFNYYDTLTPHDTHVYDMSELDRNNSVALSSPDFTGGHGIVAITHVDTDDSFNRNKVLTGNFRIQDSDGFEYRTNFPGAAVYEGGPSSSLRSNINFNNVDGSFFSDLVVISINYISDPGGVMPVPQIYDVTLYDENENPISCPPAALGCIPEIPFVMETQTSFEEPVINVGVNQVVTNSRGGPSLCLGTDEIGFLELSVDEVNFNPQGYFIFVGLNNGNGTGSMDSALYDELFIPNG